MKDEPLDRGCLMTSRCWVVDLADLVMEDESTRSFDASHDRSSMIDLCARRDGTIDCTDVHGGCHILYCLTRGIRMS